MIKEEIHMAEEEVKKEEDKSFNSGAVDGKMTEVVKPEVPEPEKIPKTTLKELREERSKLEKATEESVAQLKKVEAFEVERTLAGEASTNHPRQKTKDQIADANAKKMLAGTGYAEELFPDVE